MIPNVIHYCWFGLNPLPEDAVKCINSWKKFFPEYEIKEWNEANFSFADCSYAVEAYNAKKWAFVSDYARFKILYEFGGVYFDTDVEVIKPMDNILNEGPFMGVEAQGNPAPGLGLAVNPGLGLAANPGLGFYKIMIDKYKKLHFLNKDGSYNLKTVVEYTTEELKKLGLKSTKEIQTVENINIFPADYFCPMDYITGEITITSNTRSIHHYKASWQSELELYAHAIKKRLDRKLPRKLAGHIAAFIANVKYEGFGIAFSKTIKVFQNKK